MHPKEFLLCAWKALLDLIYQDGIEHAGYLAFLAMLSLFPFLVFFLATVGFIGESEVGTKLIQLILYNEVLPENVIKAIEPRIAEIASGPPQGLLTISIVGAIWTASSAVEGLRTILNRAYRVSTPPAYLWRRFMSIIQFLIITIGIILTMITLIGLPAAWAKINSFINLENIEIPFSISNMWWGYIRYFIITCMLYLTVVILYFIIPNIKQSFKSVAPGALVVVTLWFLAGMLFTGYLENFDQVNLIYGSLGGIIATLLFFYITAMIFIYGAEFNYHIDQSMGIEIEEKEETPPTVKDGDSI